MTYHNRNNSQEVQRWLKRMGMQPVESVQTQTEAAKAAKQKADRNRVAVHTWPGEPNVGSEQ